MRSRRPRSPPAGGVCWMLTLRVPASRRDRAAADLARCAGLSLVQSRRFGPCVWPGSARRVVAWMRSAAKAWLEIASTSGICVALQPDCVGSGASPAEGLLGANANWRVWRTPLDPSKAQHRKCGLWVSCEFRSDRLDRLRDFGRDRPVLLPQTRCQICLERWHKFQVNSLF